MSPLPTPDRPVPSLPDQTALRDRLLAMLKHGLVSEVAVCHLLGVGIAQLYAWLADPAVMQRVQRLAAQLDLGGDLTQPRAMKWVGTYIERLGQMLTDPDTSPRMLVEIGRELSILSGARSRAEAEGKVCGVTSAEHAVETELSLIGFDGYANGLPTGPAQLLRIVMPDPAQVRVKETPPVLDGISTRVVPPNGA